MTYTFVDISTVKFSINSRELFKTFIPFFVDNNHIKIISVYDSKTVLIPTTHVSEFEVDGNTYNNATDLSNAIHTVIFSRSVDGSVNNAQIEVNRLAIIDLQNDKANVNHNHDTRYYTQAQVDAKIQSIVSASDLLAKGEVDGDDINFRKADDSLVFKIDAETFTRQGTLVSFENGVLTLKNDKGEVLSTTNVEAKESYYDKFIYASGLEDDLNDLILTDPFQLVKTDGDLYFFVSDSNNIEDFIVSRLFINTLDLFIDLDVPTIENVNFRAWQINIPSETFIEDESYSFGFWLKNRSESSNDIDGGSAASVYLDSEMFDAGGA